MQIELLTHNQSADHDVTAKLAKVLLLLDEPVKMKRTLITDPELPPLALRIGGNIYTVPDNASERELLALLGDALRH